MKLTDEDVLNIRNARADGDGVTYLAAKYAVDTSTIQKIIRGLRREDVGGPLVPRNDAWPKGMKPVGTVLTDHQVVVIRLKAQAGARGKDLAKEYSVTPSTITDIVNGRTRRNLPGPRRHKYLLTDDQVRELREEYAAGGVTHKELAARYAVTKATIQNIASGTTRKSAGGPITKRKTSTRESE